MTPIRRALVLAPAVLALAAACGKGSPDASAKDGRTATIPASPAADAKPQPYSYPAPVKGDYSEVNTGDFELVDGVAWGPTSSGDTAIYVTDKPIASPILGARCPMTEARALTVLREGNWNEVDLDAKGGSRYFSAGTQWNGTSRSEDVGSHDWKVRLRDGSGTGEQIAGHVTHKYYGNFEFDLPVRHPAVPEVSEVERMDGGLSRLDPPSATPDAVAAFYTKLRAAALAHDLAGFLAAQGFDAGQIEKIRGLEGIDADLEKLSQHFLTAEKTEVPEIEPGNARVGAEGTNSKGAKFINYYFIAQCGDRLLLAMIGENPQ